MAEGYFLPLVKMELEPDFGQGWMEHAGDPLLVRRRLPTLPLLRLYEVDDDRAFFDPFYWLNRIYRLMTRERDQRGQKVVQVLVIDQMGFLLL
jgi:hypothetical protein